MRYINPIIIIIIIIITEFVSLGIYILHVKVQLLLLTVS